MPEIRQREMEFLSGEIDSWAQQEIITQEQAENILSLYEVKARNLNMILFIAGGVLLGLGAVSFALAHWHELPKVLRVCMIVGGYLASLAAYALMGRSETRWGKAFLLLSSVIFGAGIYLITRMYDYAMSFESVMGWWANQIIITALIFGDTWQVYLAQAVALLYLNLTNAIDVFALQFVNSARVPVVSFFTPLEAWVMIGALWLAWRRVSDRTALNVNMFLTLLLTASRMSLCFGGTWALVILAAAGAVMSFLPFGYDSELFGLIMLGMFGLMLTWPDVWRGELFASPGHWAVGSAFVTASVMLVNIYRGHTAAGVVFCAVLASRYFFDHFFGYMSKAWGFAIVGIIFLGAGIFLRRRGDKEVQQ